MTEFDTLERALRAGRSDDEPLPDLTDVAAAAGLLDVAYATLDSPVGRLLLATSDRGLLSIAYLDDDRTEDAVLEHLAARVSPRVLAAPRRLDEPRRELEEYFAGHRDHFELPLDWQLTSGFARRVLRATARIPFGAVSTYKQVATRGRQPARVPRRRQRARHEPAADRRAVPPGPARRRRPRRLHGRHGPQADTARGRGLQDGALTPITRALWDGWSQGNVSRSTSKARKRSSTR